MLSSVIDKSAVMYTYKQNQNLFLAGSQPLGVFILKSGLVKIEVNAKDGHTHILRIIGPDGIIGYRSLFANEPYHANAVALEDVVLHFIPKVELLQLFAEYPELSLRFMEAVCKDLRMADEKWMAQVNKCAVQRVAESIMFLQDHFKDQHWTRKDIAQWAGTTPETVIRSLAQFEKEGLVDQAHRQITILDKKKLTEKYLTN